MNETQCSQFSDHNGRSHQCMLSDGHTDDHRDATGTTWWCYCGLRIGDRVRVVDHVGIVRPMRNQIGTVIEMRPSHDHIPRPIVVVKLDQRVALTPHMSVETIQFEPSDFERIAPIATS